MSSGREWRAGLARLIAVCAALLGLFLMHGAPASAAGDCHDVVTASMATAPGGHAASAASAAPAAAAPVVLHHPMAAPNEHTVAETGPEAHGTSCVSTAPRDQLPLPAGALALALAITLLAAWSLRTGWALGRTGRRGPPGGRRLLLNVCIART
ncbi:hypothetical protein [Streptomyces sp. NPDC006463]|uniref:hypothetical protein n=1 Tax=Streptomyces sp. NPDC006463 TaxID=3364746 RepID=UPI00367FEA8B